MEREAPTVSVPAGELVYAIGDIHGRSDLLSRILALIEQDAASHDASQKTLIFMGDYVDRGPESRGVIETLLHGLPKHFKGRFLKGNHEQLLLDVLRDPQRVEHWRRNGGDATMRSYGVDVHLLQTAEARPERWRDAFVDALPQSHLAFLQGLRLQHTVGDYFFVHAGVRPGVPLGMQSANDLLWIRGDFLESTGPFGKVVVHGHTPGPEPVVKSNRIGIDTGAVFTGRLTALRLINDEVSFLQTPA